MNHRFSRSLTQIIPTRTSLRTYLSKTLELENLSQIRQILSDTPPCPFDGSTRFELIEMPELDPNERKKLGTYGVIKGAQYFIVGIVKPSQYNYERLGYLLERIILYATDMGLGTCWLGGTFKKSAFAEKVQIANDENIPAITPIGKVPDQRGLVDRVMRWSIKASARKAWNELFYNGNVSSPLTDAYTGPYRIPLEMVRLGPSARNKQPWRIIKEPQADRFHFFIQTENNVFRYQRLDIGIAVCHFDLVCQELGLKGKWVFNCNNQPTISKPQNFTYVITWMGE